MATFAFSQVTLQALDKAALGFERDLDRSFIQNIQSGGRPKWLKTRRGGAPLQKTGILRNSINVATLNQGSGKYEFIAKVNNVKYARIHQFGGWIKPKNKKALAIPLTNESAKKTPKDYGKELFWRKSKKSGRVTGCVNRNGKVIALYILVGAVYIPARPYFVIQKEDEQLLKNRIKNSLITVYR